MAKTSCADAIAKGLAKAFDDKFVRSLANKEQQILCYRVEVIKDGFRQAYANVSNEELNKEKGKWFNIAGWPSVEDLDGVFDEAAKIYMRKAYELVSRKNAQAIEVLYEPERKLIFWTPRRIAVYEKDPKKFALQHITTSIKNLVKDGGHFASSKEGFDYAYNNQPEAIERLKAEGLYDKNSPYSVYSIARRMSPELNMGAELQGLHMGDTVIGSARASMMLKSLQAFTGSQDFGSKTKLRSVTQLLKHGVGVGFDIDYKGGAIKLDAKSMIMLEVGHVWLNLGKEKQKLDWTNIDKIFLDVVKEAEKAGHFNKVFECAGGGEVLSVEAANKLTDEFAEAFRSKAVRVSSVKTQHRGKTQIDKEAILKGQSAVCPAKAVKQVKIVPSGGKTTTKRKRRNQISPGQRKRDSILEASIQRKLPGVLRKNMQYPKLRWQTGVFGRGVRVRVGRTPVNQILTVSYDYIRDPYKLYDLSMGVRIFDSKIQTPAREPRPLIENSIREILTQLIDEEYHINRRPLYNPVK